MDPDFIEDIALTRFSSPFAGMFIPNQKIKLVSPFRNIKLQKIAGKRLLN